MKVCVAGAGYVGLVTAACLSDMGNSVVCLDVDAARVEGLHQGRMPIHEPGLTDLVHRNAGAGRLQCTTDAARAVGHGTIIFIAVGTPAAEDGSADLQHVLAVTATIGQHMSDYKLIVDKSTVPVGTANRDLREAPSLVIIEELLPDGRNHYDPALMKQLGFEHLGIGRAQTVARSTHAPMPLRAVAA